MDQHRPIPVFTGSPFKTLVVQTFCARALHMPLWRVCAVALGVALPTSAVAQNSPIVDLTDPNVSVDLSVLDDGGIATELSTTLGTTQRQRADGTVIQPPPGKPSPVSQLYIKPSSGVRLPQQTKSLQNIQAVARAEPHITETGTEPEDTPTTTAMPAIPPMPTPPMPSSIPMPRAVASPDVTVVDVTPVPTRTDAPPAPMMETATKTPPPTRQQPLTLQTTAKPTPSPDAVATTTVATPAPAATSASSASPPLTATPPSASKSGVSKPTTPSTKAPIGAPVIAQAPPPASTAAPPTGTGLVVPLPPQPDPAPEVTSIAPETRTSPSTSNLALKDGDSLRIVFDAKTAKLPKTVRGALLDMATKIRSQANLRLQLLAYAGGADASASAARRLSLSRALAVRSFLIESGVRSTRIDVRALGNKSTDAITERVDITVVER